MSLKVYNRKRKFDETPEPRGKKVAKGKGQLRFVVQMHAASRLHWDLRLEFGGVFKSWAVPKGPSLNPLDQRLAVFVEDHPLAYGSFEGIIPKGNYGAGTVMVWDEGTYVERGSFDDRSGEVTGTRAESERAMHKAFEKGHITFVADGEKLKGEFALIKLKKDAGGKAWLLVKKRDAHASYKRSSQPNNNSVKSGRPMEDIASESAESGNVWIPGKTKTAKPVTAKKSAKKGAKPKSEPLSAVKKERAKISSAVATTRTHTDERSKSKDSKLKSSKSADSERTKTSDPMPRRNRPMLPVRSHGFVKGPEWIFEKELGGLRAIAEIEGKRVHLYSKALLPFNSKYPEIVEELKSFSNPAVVDGEIVKTRGHATYFIYDLLFFDGQDLRERSLKERRKLLESAVTEGTKVRLVEPVTEGMKKRATESKNPKAGAQNLIAKNLESAYHSGTSDDWLVVSPSATEEHRGSVKNPSKTSPATSKKLHAKPANSTTKSSRTKTATPHSLEEARLTNLDKIYWPEEKYTKGDLLDYYKQIAPYILPYLKDRPESLNRHPNGITQPGFYQKDMTGHIPRWLKTERVFSESSGKSIDYVLVQDERSLLYIAHLGCIEINPWFSRVGHFDEPDFLVIDLDPDDLNPFSHVVEVAHAVHEILDSVGAANAVKTSGSTGVHIGVPTGAKYSFDEVRGFAEMVCRIVAKKFPATTSVERSPNRRRGKIYLDFMQNRRAQTLAAPFCVRPKPSAPVSMPLTWKELTPRIKPEQFNIENA
ncbi:MAG: non-homologous end-joining DNA ligase, partial [Bdellovibrionia bacterium]